MADKKPVPDHGLDSHFADRTALQEQLEHLVDKLAAELPGFEKRPVHGRIYPADSIKYRTEHELIQTTSSPSYWGSVWSLTCCKHDMRQEHFYDFFREDAPGVLQPTEPLFVFTSAAISGSDRPDWAAERRRWLASVALVTHAFKGMDDYGRFLLNKGEEAWKPRITTQEKAEASDWAIRHGDCHAIVDGGEIQGVDAPHPDHDHVSSSGTVACGCNERIDAEYTHAYHDDNDRSFLKFVSTSEYWLSWSRPEFYWTQGQSRARWGGGRPKRAYRPERKTWQDDTVLAELQEVV